MNLLLNPTPGQLQQLIESYSDFLNYYDILVDHYGEVYIRNTADSSIEMVNKYQFHFRAFLRGKHSVGEQAAQNKNYINQLFSDLLYCRDNNMIGQVNYDELPRVRNLVKFKKHIQERETLTVALLWNQQMDLFHVYL